MIITPQNALCVSVAAKITGNIGKSFGIIVKNDKVTMQEDNKVYYYRTRQFLALCCVLTCIV